MDLLERIDTWGRSTPEQIAHVGSNGRITYGELMRCSNGLAAHIAANLPDDGSPVIVQGHKECEMLVAFLAVAKAGHPYVPVDSVLPAQRISRIISASGAKLTITPDYVSALAGAIGSPPERRREASDPYYIMFTSGSTGEPKGVVITRGGLNFFLDWMMGEQRPSERSEVFLDQATYSFDISNMGLYMPLLSGGTAFSVTSEDVVNPKKLYAKLASSQLTVWVSTPSFARMCLAERTFNQEMLPGLRSFLFCGETLPPEVAAELLRRFPSATVWNTYGPTEAAVAMTSVRIDNEMLRRYPSLPIGFPMPGCEVFVVDENRQAVPSGERGEIIIAGPNVSPGYLGRPDLTEKVFFERDGQRAYRTGDWGRFRDGLLFFEGRMDTQIKLHGYRIEIGDIEANLCTLPGIRSAVVVPEGKDGTYTSLSAYVIMADRSDGSDFEVSRKLRSALAERLPAYMLPRKFYFCETFPLTPNGKIDRRKLVESMSK